MKLGTKSILFGYHAFYIHPFFVAAAWWKLYGFPFDPRLWVAFFVHDLGYWGKPNMDGEEGESHPEWGATLMGVLFDRVPHISQNEYWTGAYDSLKWHDFCLYHSRSYARRDRAPVSRLCVADKLAGCICPNWLAIALTWLSGELKEYMVRFNRATVKEWANDHRKETLNWIESELNNANHHTVSGR